MAFTKGIYPVGTKVKIVSEKRSDHGRECFIFEAKMNYEDDEPSYGAGGVWWYDHSELEFVAEATDESVAEVTRHMEYSPDFDEDEDE
jgi:hypothetical protein